MHNCGFQLAYQGKLEPRLPHVVQKVDETAVTENSNIDTPDRYSKMMQGLGVMSCSNE